jgi:hypothetical protein
MSTTRLLTISCLTGLLAFGCQGKNKVLKSNLQIIALAYHNLADSNAERSGPKNVEELQKAFKPDAAAIQRVKDGELVVRWGLRLPGDFPEGTSNTVLAYEKNAPTKGGAVVMGDGQFRMMTAEEFNNSPLPVTEKERRAERAKLREQVQKIIAGKSDIHEINVAGQVLGVGDTALVSKWGSVEVMNLSPVRSTNSSFVFKEQGHFDTGGVVAGGTIKILGFTDDKSRALVEYTLPNGAQAAGVQAPSGVQYFISVISFTQMKK